MTTIKSQNIWFNEPQLHDGEEVILSYPANHTQGKRAVGGKLFVTTLRIVFLPNRIDSNLGGKTLELPRSTISSLGTDQPRYSISEFFSGALRTRLAIRLEKREDHYFVVEEPERVSQEIQSAISGKP